MSQRPTTTCAGCHPAPCPCPSACELPEQCPTWRRGATPAGHLPPSTRATAMGLALHALAVLLAGSALVFIVKTAASA